MAPRANLFVGLNGAGKTNLLEAVSYLCLGKSFLASTDQHAVQHDASFFSVEGAFSSEGRSNTTIRLAYVPGEGKRAFVSGAPLDRLADLVGKAPVVILSPADYELTAGGPSERRRFLDTTLSQVYPVYLDDLLKYRRALKQRNALLQHVRKGRALDSGTMAAWDEELATLGGRVIERRVAFLAEFGFFVEQAFSLLNEPGGDPGLSYAPSVSDLDEPTAAFRRALSRSYSKSSQLGRTLVGPHLDEVAFRLDGIDLRPFASQGQHRTFALTLRLAQALFLRDRLEEDPLLLLDDVFGTLDPDRTTLVLSLLSSGQIGQSLITAAREEPFLKSMSFEGDEHAVFHVEHGSVTNRPSHAASLN